MNADQTMLTRVFTAMLVIGIAGITSTAYLLDGPTDLEAAQDTAHAVADVAHAAAKQARFERAANQACGTHGGWALVDGDSVQCVTAQGRIVVTAKVAL